MASWNKAHSLHLTYLRDEARQRIAADKSRKRAFAKLKEQTHPIGALRDSGDHITMQPARMDAILQDTWKKVYEGNVPNIPQHIATYITKYAQY